MDNGVMDNAADTNQSQAESLIQPTEKMIPQSQVNEIVGTAKREAAERAVEAYKRQYAQSQPQSSSLQSNEQQSARNFVSEDDIKRFTGDEIKRHFGELEREAQERAHMESANRIVATYRDKITPGKEKYEDFDLVTGNVMMQNYPNVVQLLAEYVDNSADVLYHLAKNRSKLYELESICSHSSPDAIYEIKRLSESIKSNEESSQIKHANSPLSQNRPSNTGTGSGALTVRDYKRLYKG